MTDRDELLRAFRDVIARADESTELAEKFCASPIRKKFLAATYVCPDRRGCVLAYVYATPKGIIVHTPRYKVSPTVNEASSSAAGREKNTVDGDRRWKASSYFLEQAANVTLNCDHVRQALLSNEEVEAAATRRAGRLPISGDDLIS